MSKEKNNLKLLNERVQAEEIKLRQANSGMKKVIMKDRELMPLELLNEDLSENFRNNSWG